MYFCREVEEVPGHCERPHPQLLLPAVLGLGKQAAQQPSGVMAHHNVVAAQHLVVVPHRPRLLIVRRCIAHLLEEIVKHGVYDGLQQDGRLGSRPGQQLGQTHRHLRTAV